LGFFQGNQFFILGFIIMLTTSRAPFFSFYAPSAKPAFWTTA